MDWFTFYRIEYWFGLSYRHWYLWSIDDCSVIIKMLAIIVLLLSFSTFNSTGCYQKVAWQLVTFMWLLCRYFSLLSWIPTTVIQVVWKNQQIIASCFRKQVDLHNVVNHGWVTFIRHWKTINMFARTNIKDIKWDFRNLSFVI